MTDRTAAVRRAFLVAFGIETPQKAVAKIATVAIAVPIAVAVGWFYPVEPWWGKLLQLSGSWIIAMAIIYLWTHFTLKMPPVNIGLSPLYTALGLEQFRSAQRTIEEEKARLTSASQQLAAAMTKLDVTTQAGQEQFRELAHQKKPLDQRIADLNQLPKPRLGYRPPH
jgi:hypothetical protein